MARRLGTTVGRRLAANDTPETGVGAEQFFVLAYGRAPNADEIAASRRPRTRAADREPGPGAPRARGVRRAVAPDRVPRPATSGNLERLELPGFALWIDADDPAVSSVIGHERGWEQHVSDLLMKELRAGSTFVDVGANVGFHTFLASSLVGPTGSVLALEPSSENCRLLQLSKTDNRAENVTILPFALDRTGGVRYLTTHLGSNAGLIPDPREHLIDGRGTPVYATTLDQIAPPRIDVMKIDVEGRGIPRDRRRAHDHRT